MSSMVNIALWSKVDENTVGLHRVGLEHDRITCSKLSSGEQDLQLHEDKTSNNSRVIGRANRIARDFDYTCPWVDCLGRRVKTDEVGFNLDSGLVNLKGGGEKEDVIVIDSDDESDKKPPAKEEKKLVNDTIELLDSSDDEEDNTLLSSKRKAASSTSMCRSTMCSSTNTKMSVSDGNETFTYTSQDYEDVLLSKEIGGEVEVISGSAMVSIAKALSKEERDMIIQEYNEKAEAFDHQTDTSQLIDYSKVTLPNMRPGIALPIVFGQCCKHEVSFGNGGSVKGGRRQDFENHPSPSVRAILKLFESFPNQDDAFGWTPFFGVNGADTCPIGTLDANDEVIVICIIWIVIIAKERAEVINLFIEYARKLGVEYVFAGSVGGTSTGVDLIFNYLDLNLIDVAVKKVIHVGNIITRRYRRGHFWSNKTDQTVAVSNSFKKFCNGLVGFCKLAGIKLDVDPFQGLANDPRFPYVTNLSSDYETYWEDRKRRIKEGTTKLSGIYKYLYGQTEEDIKKRHDVAVKRYQASVENDYGLYHFSYSQSPEAIKKRHDTVMKGNKKRSVALVKAYKNNTGLHDFKTNRSSEAIKKRRNTTVQSYQTSKKNNSGLYDFQTNQSPEAKKKRSDANKTRAKNMGKEGMSKAGVQAAITMGFANWSPYIHNGTPVDPAEELRARAADPGFQGMHRGMPCVKWSKVQDSDECIYLNDGNDKRGDKATKLQCGKKWSKIN